MQTTLREVWCNNFDTNGGSAQELCKFGANTVKLLPVKVQFLAQLL